jgi:heme/copper-type cytochrome/quinol oxidase subunit 1
LRNVIRIVQFFSLFIGVNLTFFPIHFLGLQGIPRRYREYSPVFSYWHRIASLGRIIRMVSTLILVYMWWESLSSNRLVLIINWKGYFIDFLNKNPVSLHTNYESIIIVLKNHSVLSEYHSRLWF